MKFYEATPTVLALRNLEMQGNILPPVWLQYLRYENGKPHPVAAILLSDVVYWYRPIELRDEATGLVTGYAQKFKADKLQRDYKSYVDQYGFTMWQVKDGFKCLSDANVVDLEFRTVRVNPNRRMGNVMYIGLNPETLQLISDPIAVKRDRGIALKPHSPIAVQRDTLQRLLYTEITCSTENTNTEILDDDDGSSSLEPLFVQENTHSDPRVEIRAMRKIAGDLISSMGPNVWTDHETYITGLSDGKLVPLLSWLWLWDILGAPFPDADAMWKRERYKSNPFANVDSVPGKIITQVRRGARADLMDEDWQEMEETILELARQDNEST